MPYGDLSSRVVTFADNLILAADAAAGASDVFTDPVPMHGANRVSSVLHIEHIYGASAQLTLHLFGCNDSQSWVSIGSFARAAAGTYAIAVKSAPYAFVRYQMILTNSAGEAGCAFDLKSVVDAA